MSGSESKPIKVVYIPMAADILHTGHLNIIREGATLGEVVIGLLTDEAIAGYKRVPHMSYPQRYELVESIKGVSRVIPQESLDYRPNLLKLKPDYFLHGTDWQAGVMSGPREAAIETIHQWGGKLVEPEYTKGVSSTALQESVRSNGIAPTERLELLARKLSVKPYITALEAHDGLSGLIVQNASVKDDSGKPRSFDAIWVSSLTDSISKGKPDNEVVDRTSRITTINEILDVTTKPIIVDADTGGRPEQLSSFVRTLERMGVSAVVVEDKTGSKYNSFHSDMSAHMQEDPDVFASKLRAGIDARLNDNFMVIARIESLILGKDVDDAIMRAIRYLKVGVSAIMIHSSRPEAEDVREFALQYNHLPNRRPLMVVPTAYNKIDVDELNSWGANIIVYANQLLRAAYPAMQAAADSILSHGRSFEADKSGIKVTDLLKLTDNS